LDGGVAINDRGFSEGDRTLEFSWRTVSKAHSDAVARLVKSYARLHVATSDGLFLAGPESFTPGVKTSTVTLLVIKKLSA
ncbi:MAG TPA: hypothetical protein VIC02_05480, partial [Kineobactrum sp.]